MYNLRKKLVETIMANETPKPMKKVHRNLLHKVGRKLEKFEQNLGLSTPTSSRAFDSSSSSDLSTNYRRSYSEHNDEDQEDSTSLQYRSHSHSGSPQAILRHKHGEFVF